MIVTPDILLAAGYRKYPANNGEYCEALYQRRIRDANGVTLYFIDVYDWHFPDHQSFEAKAQFYRDGLTMGITLHSAQDMPLADMEGVFAEAHAAMRCGPDAHNND